MKKCKFKPLAATLALLLSILGLAIGVTSATEKISQAPSEISLSTADHTKFTILAQDFKTGPEVTKACLTCHTEASLQVHKTYHWTWESSGGVQKGIGKKNVLNNY